jgi:peptide/nickel transport system substrate-binding protein
VKAYSKTKVAFFHKEKLATNVWNCGFSIIPKHIYERSLSADPTMKASEWHAYWNRHPLSGNNYKLAKWEPNQYVLFERREDIPLARGGKTIRRRPYFKQVRFRLIENPDAALLAFKNGELDEMVLTPRQWEKQTDDADFDRVGLKVRGPEWTYSQVIWNQKRPFFADAKVRLALAYAFDSDELLNKVFFGLYAPCTGPFNPVSPWGRNGPKPIKQDPNKAEELLDAAGWKVGESGLREKGGVKFSFTLLVPIGGTGDKVAEVLKQNLKDVGIEMNIKMIEWAAYLQKVQDHDFDAGTSAWGVGADPDRAKNVWTSEAYKGGRNYGGYSNSKVDELFEKGARELDPEKRPAIYQEINRLIFEDQPYLFIYYRTTFWGFSKEMRGYNFSPRGVFSYGPGSAALWKPKKKAS